MVSREELGTYVMQESLRRLEREMEDVIDLSDIRAVGRIFPVLDEAALKRVVVHMATTLWVERLVRLN